MPRRRRGPMVIVGAGLTGGSAAKELRKRGYADELLVLADEPGFPFGRPPLTKGYLRGEEDLSGWMVSPIDWYKTQQVQLMPARVRSVEPKTRRLTLESGEAIAYDRLLLATGGGEPFLPGPPRPPLGALPTPSVVGSDSHNTGGTVRRPRRA